MLYNVTECAECILANTRPHQLHRSDWEMGTAISCTECSQMADVTKGGRDTLKALSLQMCSYMFYSLHAQLDLDYS